MKWTTDEIVAVAQARVSDGDITVKEYMSSEKWLDACEPIIRARIYAELADVDLDSWAALLRGES